MLKRRIACILLITAALILYIFDNESVTLALLLALIVMPAVSVGLLALSGRNFRISMERTTQPDENPVVRVTTENPDLVPLAAVEAEVVCTNLRTGEADSYVIRSTPRPKRTQTIDLEVLPKNAGRYEIAVSSAVLTDPLQLSSRQVTCMDREYVTIMPEIFDMQVSYASDAAMLEGDRSADSRRGNDPGEVRSIREYVPMRRSKTHTITITVSTNLSSIPINLLPITVRPQVFAAGRGDHPLPAAKLCVYSALSSFLRLPSRTIPRPTTAIMITATAGPTTLITPVGMTPCRSFLYEVLTTFSFPAIVPITPVVALSYPETPLAVDL